MIENQTIRKSLHYVFTMLYGFVRWLYKPLRSIFRPVVRVHPRIHHFAIALREAVKELIKPPEICPRIIPESVPEAPGSEIMQDAHPETMAGTHAGMQPERVPETHTDTETRLPRWLVEEWRAVHEIEPQLFPGKDILENIYFYQVPGSRIVEPYLELCELYGDNVSHVFLLPWLLKGGADLEAINYVQSLTNQNLADRIVVIATTRADSPWKKRLPEKTRFIEFGKQYAHLSDEEQEKLLVRLLLQMGPRVVHNVNSELGYKIFVKYGSALASMSKLYASLFCIDVTEEGRYAGYPVWYVPKCFEWFEAIFTDNLAHSEQLQKMYAFDAKKVHVHYQPAPLTQPKGHRDFNASDSGKRYFDILWAGRLDRQKRPDILIRIAEKCRELPFRFHVHGSPVLDMDIYTKEFEHLENITYYGEFDGLPSLQVDQYDLFLYTSQWDGLPNVLLESISLGLPVVASDVGGINELIEDERTGFLISPYDDITAYADCLQKIYRHRSILEPITHNAYELIASRHSWDAFNENVKSIPHYSVRP